MQNMMLALAPIGFFAFTGLVSCIALGWLLNDMLPLLKAPQAMDPRGAARRAAFVRPRPSVVIMPRPAQAARLRVAA